jgi:hypothetical protein
VSYCGDFRRGLRYLCRRQTLHRVRDTPELVGDQFCFFGSLDYYEPPAAEEPAEPKYDETHHNGRKNSEPFP